MVFIFVLDMCQSTGFLKAMKYKFFLIALLIIPVPGTAQWRSATLNADLSIRIDSISAPATYRDLSRSASSPVLKEGFPKIFPAHPAFKNFRNVTLADLDRDGADEIIVGVANQLHVFRDDSIWWSQSLSGLARFPVAVGDIDLDSEPEIVVLTGFNNQPGQVYVFAYEGEVKTGWPRSFDGRWMISSPALGDMNQDDTLEIICSDLEGTMGQVHILQHDGTTYNDEWPLTLPDIPAVTPSIGDLNDDRRTELVVASTRELYAFDGAAGISSGWPWANGLSKFSFQSPILADVTHDGQLEVAIASHGDLPQFMLLNAQGEYLPGWPIPVPQGSWTFHTPTVIMYEEAPLILTARPISHTSRDMLYAWRKDGSALPGFPLEKEGGLEGVITVADLDNDLEPEILFPSNLFDPEGYGFIHAYELDGSGEMDGFPIRPYGLTYMNGATIGDIDGDQRMDLVVLSYTEHQSEDDTTYLYAYELEVPISEENVLWSTYKGNNLRNGRISLPQSTPVRENLDASMTLFPNPAHGFLFLEGGESLVTQWSVIDVIGRILQSQSYDNPRDRVRIEFEGNMTPGVYFLRVNVKGLDSPINMRFIHQ